MGWGGSGRFPLRCVSRMWACGSENVLEAPAPWQLQGRDPLTSGPQLGFSQLCNVYNAFFPGEAGSAPHL